MLRRRDGRVSIFRLDRTAPACYIRSMDTAPGLALTPAPQPRPLGQLTTDSLTVCTDSALLIFALMAAALLPGLIYGAVMSQGGYSREMLEAAIRAGNFGPLMSLIP